MTSATTHTHVVTITGLADPVAATTVLRDTDGQVIIDSATITVRTDAGNRMERAALRVEILFRRLLADGRPARTPSRSGGGTLLRLPAHLIEPVIAEFERLGVTGVREDHETLTAMRKS